MLTSRLRSAVLSALALASSLVVSGARGDTIAGHEVVLDADGKLLPWSMPRERAFDHVMRLSWNRLQTWPTTEANGLKTYFTYPVFDQATLHGGAYPHIPATNNSATTDSAIRYYAYTGDRAVLDVARELLDHHLARGTSPADWVYGSFPFASSDPGQADYFGSSWCNSTCGRGDGTGNTEPDKGAELGYAYLQLYEATGDARYLEAARKIADTLARTRREGDGTRSPWPFRVNAKTGAANEEYSAHWTTTLQLFDELVRLGVGDVAAYREARAAVWSWLLAYPFKTNLWSNAFEDQEYYHDPAHDPTQYIALRLALYLLERPEIDPEYRENLAGILPWVEDNYGVDTATEKGNQYGATVISEQTVFMVKMGNHTARYAAVAALWAERTGDLAYREKAYRSLAWATYVCRANGLVSFNPDYDEWWFVTGYGDYVRNFVATLGAAPSFAPPGENHVLRSSSVVSSVAYDRTQVTYRTFHPEATEVLRVAFEPEEVTADGRALARRSDLSGEGYTVEDLGGGDRAVRIRHDAGRDVVLRGWIVDPPPAVDAGAPAASPGAAAPPSSELRAAGSGCDVAGGGAGAWAGLVALALLRARSRRGAATSRRR